jgi:hypothetical protein
MPHFGHRPGPFWTTSGSIGQVYVRPADAAGASGTALLFALEPAAVSALLHAMTTSAAAIPSAIDEYRTFFRMPRGDATDGPMGRGAQRRAILANAPIAPWPAMTHLAGPGNRRGYFLTR